MTSDVAVGPELHVRFFYKNWRGESTWRRVRPLCVWYGSTEYHPELQWLLKAFDLDKQAVRDFAMSCISDWMGEQDVNGLSD